jgi:hypothetical protein
LSRSIFNWRCTCSVTLVMLVAVVLLFTMDGAQRQKSQPAHDDIAAGVTFASVIESGSLDSRAPLGLETFDQVRAVLSNDQDHDGNPDGVFDPLADFCVHFVVLMPLVGMLLLMLCASLILRSSCRRALEQPG